MPSGFIALIHAAIFGLLLAAFVFSLFASKTERTPGPIYAFTLLVAFAAALIPATLVYTNARDVQTFLFAFSAHSLLVRGAFIAWIFYLHALADFSLRWTPRIMYAFEALRTVVFVAHLDSPYLLEIRGIERVAAPFGDLVTVAVAEPGPLHFLQIVGPILHLGYAVVVLVTLSRIGRARLARFLAVPFLVLLLLVLVDNFADSLGMPNIYVTEFAIPIVIFALAASLMDWMLAGQRARETVVEQEAQIVRVLDSIADGVVACDRRWQIVRLNPVARELARDPSSLDHALLERFEFSDPETQASPTAASLLEEPRDLLVETVAGPRLVRVTAGEVTGRAGEPVGFVIVMHDITDRARREQLGRRDEKMRALGELAGGVAHDFNNYLAAIGASARMLERRGNDPSARDLIASRIAEAVAQASSLTRKLLDFSRDGEAHVGSTDEIVSINDVVETSADLIRSIVGKRIDVISELRCKHDRIRGCMPDLQSALLNLGKNAADAIDTEGTIRIATRDAEGPGGTEAVSISVEDTGAGIPRDEIERIFEPFFTTKPLSGGTGFGLPSVHRIVSAHGGTIEVESTPGVGTTFTLTFPRQPTDRARKQAASPERAISPAHPPDDTVHPH